MSQYAGESETKDPYGASRVNGITDDMVAEASFFEQVLEEFLEFY